MRAKQPTEQGGQPTNPFFNNQTQADLGQHRLAEANGVDTPSYDEKSTNVDQRYNAVAHVFAYDYSLLPLTEEQRELFEEIKDVAPIEMWRFVERYPKRYRPYLYARIFRLKRRGLLAVMYDGPRGGKRIHLVNLLVRPGEIWVMPDGELVAWRQGDMWHIKANWIAVRQGPKRIRFALPREVLKTAELPWKLYVATEYENNDTRYIVATPSAEMAKAIEVQTALANLG